MSRYLNNGQKARPRLTPLVLGMIEAAAVRRAQPTQSPTHNTAGRVTYTFLGYRGECFFYAVNGWVYGKS